jgi:hypothetical protein
VDIRVLLLQYGFSPVKAELWSEFVQHVAMVFRTAADEFNQDENWDAFKKKRGALGVPRVRRRRKLIERIPIEDAITSELGHLIRRIRRTLPLNHFLRLNEVEFHVEDPVASETRAGRHSRKVDFYVYAATGLDTPEFAVEAKPLQNRADITARYLAEDGLGCFLTSDSPYTNGLVAGMLAYTISSAGKSWREEVRAAVSVYVPAVLHMAEVLIPGEPHPVTCSRHQRSARNLDPIATFHLEFIFKSDVQENTSGTGDGH